MTYEVTIEGRTRTVVVESAAGGLFRVTVDGEPCTIDLQRPTPEAWQMLIDGESWEAGCVPHEGGYLVDVRGVATQVEVVDPRRRPLKLGGSAAGGLIVTQMPGRIVRVMARPGDPVRKGQPVLVIEAMKMENEVKAPIDGTVAEILVTEGQAVESGTKLARITP